MSKIIQILSVPDGDGGADIMALHENGRVSRLEFTRPYAQDNRIVVTPVLYELRKPK